jgi:glycerol-3-phosphate dehydrogenase subunit B
MEYDAAVIGGGIAGCAAALSARRRLERVLLISDKPGASALSSGMLDIDADPATARTAAAADNPSFKANLAATALANPHHPYAALGGPRAAAAFEEAVCFFMDTLTDNGLPAGGALNSHLLLIGNIGAMKHTRFALPGLAEGDISDPAAMRIAVVGFEGLNEFNAEFIAKSADAAAIRVFGRGFDKIQGYEIQLSGIEGFLNLTPFSIAGMIDDSGLAEKLADKLRKYLPAGEYTHIAFPAVLGVERSAEALSLLKKALGATVFEIATVQPSVPGKRLMRALQKALDKTGVTTMSGHAASFSSESGKITSVTADLPYGAKMEFAAQNVILASGKFIGGGVRHDKELREPLFDLPVFVKNRPVRNAVVMELLTERIIDKQELFTCGVRTDTSLRPLDEKDEPVYENLMCAGSVIGGYDPMFDRCGAGVSIITGVLAGNYAG